MSLKVSRTESVSGVPCCAVSVEVGTGLHARIRCCGVDVLVLDRGKFLGSCISTRIGVRFGAVGLCLAEVLFIEDVSDVAVRIDVSDQENIRRVCWTLRASI